MPKISIITPIYNGEQFIESCIKNVIEQNCVEMEHIIVDGGSKDRTVEIVNNYSKNYPHIRWISEKDRGQSDAMNKGIRMAKAEVIGILNVDDYYEPNVLNRVLEIFSTLTEGSFITGNCKSWNGRGKLLKINKPRKMRLRDLLLGYDINTFPNNPSSYFYHKSLHDRVGFYRLDEHYGMDMDFILKAVQVTHVKYFDETWGNYIKHEDSKTVKDQEKQVGFGLNSSLIRRERMYNQCVRNLPLKQQIPMWFLRAIGTTYTYSKFYYFLVIMGGLTRIKYFSRHPDELIPSIKKKFRNLSN